MKKRIALLIVLSIVCMTIIGLGFGAASAASVAPAKVTPAAPTVVSPPTQDAVSAFQRVNYVTAVVSGCDMLNVRQGPSTTYQITSVLKKGQSVKVFGKLGNWYAIYEPEKGIVGTASGAYLKAAVTQAASAPQTSTTPTVAPKTVSSTEPPAKTLPKPSPTVVTPVLDISKDEQSLMDLINKARADAGADSLAFDTDLLKDARLKAKDMVDNNYFSHQSPTFGSPFDMMKQSGISFKSAGENIAGNQTIQGAFNAWMSSEGHKKNILNPSYNYSGIGIADSPTYGKIIVEQFIGR